MRPRRKRDADKNGLAQARAEREKSEQRLEAVREHVVRPLQKRGDKNQFADMLRALITEGGRR